MDSGIGLQPLTEIHLTSKLQNEFQVNGDKPTVYGLLSIAVLVLFLAIINYINLSTSRAVERSKEVGVRKVIGSVRSQLIAQFMVESFCIVLLAVIVALTSLQLFLPWFNDWLHVSLSLDQWNTIELWGLLLIIVTALTVASGLYPAVIMSNFKPVSLVKGHGKSNRKFTIRDVLMVFQFSVSLFLIVCTGIIVRQVNFLDQTDTGFRKDQVLVVDLLELLTESGDTAYVNYLEVLKSKLGSYDVIHAATVTSAIPGKKSAWRGVNLNAGDASGIISYRTRVDADFTRVFDIPLVAGRFFRPGDEQSDRLLVVANQTFVETLGFSSAEEALGQKANMGRNSEIIGVLQDFHQISPRYAIDPAIFTVGAGHKSYLSIAFDAQDYRHVVSVVEKNWKESFPAKPFVWFFLEDHFQKQFMADQRMSEAVSAFALLSVFLACMGLIGLSTAMARHRLKEMGIRKVLGASITDLLQLLSRRYMVLILMGATIGLPLAGYVSERWLEEHALKVEITVLSFMLPVMVMMILSLLVTVSQSWQTVRKNPVDSLRYE